MACTSRSQTILSLLDVKNTYILQQQQKNQDHTRELGLSFFYGIVVCLTNLSRAWSMCKLRKNASVTDISFLLPSVHTQNLNILAELKKYIYWTTLLLTTYEYVHAHIQYWMHYVSDSFFSQSDRLGLSNWVRETCYDSSDDGRMVHHFESP